jgi:putative ABC transport system permease protein
MKAPKLFSQAARSMRRYWVRSILMVLGVVVGIASLGVLSSIGEATRRETTARFKNMLGTFDTIIVRPGGGRSRGMPTLVNVQPTLRFEDADAIARELPEIKAVAEMQTAFDVDIKYRDRTTSVVVIGVSPNWLQLRSEDVQDGAFFTQEQNSSLARVAVLGTEARATLFPDEDPLGKNFRIVDVPFQVIGSLKSRGAGPGDGSLDNLVLIPVDTASRRLFNRDFLTMLVAQVRDPERSTEATDRVTALLRDRHHIRPPALDDFTITNPAATMAQVTRARSTLTTILTGVAAMALLIGGAVIMSLMSIAVSERRKEIGVKRSVGATRADIVAQFLLEAILVASTGGVIGALGGWTGMQLVTRMQNLSPILVWRPFAAGILVSTAIGVVFGIYPAWKASKLDPIQVIRL